MGTFSTQVMIKWENLSFEPQGLTAILPLQTVGKWESVHTFQEIYVMVTEEIKN